jgi:hypothetical protein
MRLGTVVHSFTAENADIFARRVAEMDPIPTQGLDVHMASGLPSKSRY